MSTLTKTVLALALAAPLWGSAQAQDATNTSADAESVLKAIQTDYYADMRAHRAEQMKLAEEAKSAAEKAKAEGKPAPAMPAMSMGLPAEMTAKYLERYQSAAVDYAGTDDAIPFLAAAVSVGLSSPESKDSVLAACQTLTTTHLKSEALGNALRTIHFAGRLIGADEAERMILAIESGSPHPNVQALAIITRVNESLENADVKSDAFRAAKVEALRAIALATDERIIDQAQSTIDRREKFAPGQVAPDIAGVDLDGTAFKLSDYKGKIVLLDFWGDW